MSTTATAPPKTRASVRQEHRTNNAQTLCQSHEPEPALTHSKRNPYQRTYPSSPSSHSQTTLMNPLRPQLIILHPRHKALAQPLIDHKNNLRRNLRAQKHRLVEPRILPLWKILRHFRQLDAGRGLAVTGMRAGVRGVVLQVLLGLGVVVGV